MNEIRIGDIVRLNSGSIDMTVIDIDGNDIQCRYYNDELSKFINETFHVLTLTIIPKD